MNQLQPVSVAAPGFYGLNKQSSAVSLSEGWAIEADNAVFDDSGRVAARNGWTQTTTTPISATPAIETLFEYINTSGTTKIISAAANKLYHGTATLTDITGSVTVTDNNWKFQNLNGNVIGFQSGHDPIIYKGSSTFSKLLLEASAWQATTAYALGAVVRATSDDNRYYVVLAAPDAGTTGGTEPTWNTTEGATTTDGTVTWTTCIIPQSDECLSAFGRSWITDGTVVYYSDLLIPYNYVTNSGGSIDLKSVWAYGMDQVIALHEFNGHLVIFGKHNITIYSGADDPTNMALVEQLSGIGCIARDSIQNIGGDLLFLSDTGLRSLQRTIQEKSMPLREISKNNRDYMMVFARSETKNLIRSVYHEVDSFYLLNFPSAGVTFCFDTRQRLEDGSFRTTTWSEINPTAMVSTRDDKLYLGQAGVIGTYAGYQDNTSSYLMFYRSPWLNAGNQQIKIPKRIRATVRGGYNYTVNLQWAFDYKDSAYTVSMAVPNDGISEYNIAEYNVDEWSGGDNIATLSGNMSRSGEVMQFGWAVTINGQPISFQKIDIYFKLGRLNR